MVPKTARRNDAAQTLLDAVKLLPTGKALKIRLGRITKISCNTAKKYALDEGIRIGVRLTSESAFLWKLTESEIAEFVAKGQAIASARAKKGAKKAASAR